MSRMMSFRVLFHFGHETYHWSIAKRPALRRVVDALNVTMHPRYCCSIFPSAVPHGVKLVRMPHGTDGIPTIRRCLRVKGLVKSEMVGGLNLIENTALPTWERNTWG